jgi:hypothetical protein
VVWQRLNEDVLTLDAVANSFKMLQCQAMKAGVHKWSILVEVIQYHVFALCLGVASTVHQLDTNASLAGQEGAWALSHLGGAIYHNSMVLQDSVDRSFRTGSKITFILDLTGEGTLSASVDGKPATQLFGAMRTKFDDPTEVGFVPAAALNTIHGDTARIRFLGFE